MPTPLHSNRRLVARGLCVFVGTFLPATYMSSQAQQPQPADAVQRSQQPSPVPAARPEQNKSAHDESDVFTAPRAEPSSPVLQTQPKNGKNSGFDFVRDPLNSDAPMASPDELMRQAIAAKPGIMAAQHQVLAQRYLLEPHPDPAAKMSRGKPLPVGPTARLHSGLTWDRLATLSADQIKAQGVFPYPALPHPLHAVGGQVFPRMQLAMFPRLERFDVDYDLPEAFLPEFPPAIFLSNRPELGDVSRGEVVSINNYYRLFKDILTPVQLDGLRLLLTPFPQEEFNPTDDRKTRDPSLGVTCLDCHINGHTTGQFHLTPDFRPRAAVPSRHDQSARSAQSADSRLKAKFAVRGRLHRVRTAHRLL
jgi:hypothetical protein